MTGPETHCLAAESGGARGGAADSAVKRTDQEWAGTAVTNIEGCA